MTQRVYLAGPDVFLPNARRVGERKVALCKRYGLTGCFPLDNDPPDPMLSGAPLGHSIYRRNIALMLSCDAIVANLTPFRGPSADVGTVFELGFFAALGRPLFAYSADARDFATRTRAALGLGDDAADDAAGLAIEPFGLADNLMLHGAVVAANGVWVAMPEPAGCEAVAAFAAFEACLAAVAELAARPAAMSVVA